jgi:carboxymethylenebutenolidase
LLKSDESIALRGSLVEKSERRNYVDRIYVMQLVRSFQVGEISRRDFLKKATAALGSAATANLLLAACNASPTENPPPVIVEEGASEAEAPVAETGASEGLATEMVSYTASDGQPLMGYLARPAEGGPFPAIVVIQEWWGLNEHIKDLARRFARENFVALAPDLYHGAVASEPDEARKLVMELDMPAAVQEIQRAIDFLQEQEAVSGPEVGIVGYCMGGGLVLQTALISSDLGAAVVYYGQPLTPARAVQVRAPILGFFGAEDGGIPVPDVEAMYQAFDEAGLENEVHIYEGAGHAFFNDTRDSYNAEAAADAWPRTLDWFRTHLAG